MQHPQEETISNFWRNKVYPLGDADSVHTVFPTISTPKLQRMEVIPTNNHILFGHSRIKSHSLYPIRSLQNPNCAMPFLLVSSAQRLVQLGSQWAVCNSNICWRVKFICNLQVILFFSCIEYKPELFVLMVNSQHCCQ